MSFKDSGKFSQLLFSEYIIFSSSSFIKLTPSLSKTIKVNKFLKKFLFVLKEKNSLLNISKKLFP